MSLERRTVTYNGDTYTRLIGEKVTTTEEITKLADVVYGGNYFFGGVLDTGSEVYVYYGSGPTHDIFKQMIKEIVHKEGVVSTCQIGVNRRTCQIEGVLFSEDPGKNENHVSIDENDTDGVQRRITRISAVLKALHQNLYDDSRIPVGWLERTHEIEYVYFPQKGILEKN